jgi:hypothetical protein
MRKETDEGGGDLDLDLDPSDELLLKSKEV